MLGMKRHGVALVLGLALLVSCEGGPSANKAGGDVEPVTLRIGTYEVADTPTGAAIEEFARQVDDLSGGEIRIEPVWNAPGYDQHDWDQVVARMVMNRDLDMGLVPSRSWDMEGVTTLRALNAPFLVTSEALVEDIVSGDLAGEMTAGLTEVGVTGLALLPEEMRRVFAWDQPLVAPEDFEGATIRVPSSDTVYAFFEALGARPDDILFSSFHEAVISGQVDGAETSFASALGLPGGRPVAVGNGTLFPKVNVLVVNTPVFDALSEDQRDVVRQAAVQVRDWSLSSTTPDAEAAREFCDAGGSIVLAEDADLAALELAARPVYEELERDPATRGLIEEIRLLEADTSPPPAVEPCGEPASDGAAAGLEPDRAVFPQGVYRMEITAQAMIDAGVSREDAGNHAGIWTLTFDDGNLVIEDVRARDGLENRDDGVYCVDGERVFIDISGGPTCRGYVLFSATWVLEDGELRFTGIRSEEEGPASQDFHEVLWGLEPWTKIR